MSCNNLMRVCSHDEQCVCAFVYCIRNSRSKFTGGARCRSLGERNAYALFSFGTTRNARYLEVFVTLMQLRFGFIEIIIYIACGNTYKLVDRLNFFKINRIYSR